MRGALEDDVAITHPVRFRQGGVSLFEVSVVLLCIALLAAGALKASKMIDVALAKTLVREMRDVPALLYAYRDRYGAIPGDDDAAATHMSGAVSATNATAGNSLIDWNYKGWTGNDTPGAIGASVSNSGESGKFWHHLLLAGMARVRTNAVRGFIGITSVASEHPVRPAGATGIYVVCSSLISGAIARLMDIEMDDGDATTGQVWAAEEVGGDPVYTAKATSAYVNTKTFTVCTAF